MNDDLYLEYLLQMGAMSPEEEKLARRQARVDALREKSMQTPTGEMVGKHYVAPSWTQYAAQLGNAFMANKGQGKIDQQYGEFNKTQGDAIRKLQERMAQRRAGNAVTPSAPIPEDDEEMRSRYGGWYSSGY